MILTRNIVAFKSAIYSKIFHFIIDFITDNIIKHIPLLSVAIEGWQLSTRTFANERKKYLRLQQWKIFFSVLINPIIATKWFEILKSPDFRIIPTHRPRLYFKPFRVYMSIRWSKKYKIKVILDTYRFILNKADTFKRVITCSSGIEIARFKLNETFDAHLNLGYDDKYRKEGELVLSFVCDQLGGIIVSSAFSFEEMENGSWVCWIGCIQGHPKNTENLSKTTQKLLHGFRPKSFIIFIIQEFTRQFGFKAIYGAGDAIQAYRRKHAIHLPWRHEISFDYNAIWSESGGRPACDGWYELPLIPIRKNFHEIKTHKRSLYHRRYSLCDDISLKISNTVTNLL